MNATYQPGFVGAGGALVAAWPMASLGRRPALLLTSALFVAAAALKASFLSPLIAPDLCGGPASIGFGVGWLAMGLSSSVVPLYVGEVAPVARRGSLVGLYQLAFSFGLLLAPDAARHLVTPRRSAQTPHRKKWPPSSPASRT